MLLEKVGLGGAGARMGGGGQGRGRRGARQGPGVGVVLSGTGQECGWAGLGNLGRPTPLPHPQPVPCGGLALSAQLLFPVGLIWTNLSLLFEDRIK